MNMKKRIKKLWLKALRSGKYKQGKGCLRADRKYCCLGVLCDVYAKEKGERWGASDDARFYSMHGEIHVLPTPVMRWAGLNDSNPFLGDENAAPLNDNGTSFKKIANLIEKHL